MNKPGLPPLLYEVNVNKAQAIRLSGYSVIMFFLAVAVFAGITHTSESGNLVTGGVSLVVYALTILAHEAVHGLFFWGFGGKPRYGVGIMHKILPYAYASAPGQPYTLGEMTVIGLAPLVSICVFAVVIALGAPKLANLMAVVFMGNFAGAVGDLWLMRQMWRFRKVHDLVVVDTRNGLEIYGSGEAAAAAEQRSKESANPGRWGNRVMLMWVSAFSVLVLVNVTVPVLLAIANYRGQILIGPMQFPLFLYEHTDKTMSFSVNPFASIIGALVFSAVYGGLLKVKNPGTGISSKSQRV